MNICLPDFQQQLSRCSFAADVTRHIVNFMTKSTFFKTSLFRVNKYTDVNKNLEHYVGIKFSFLLHFRQAYKIVYPMAM